MADASLGPDNPSTDYQAMQSYWAMIKAINGGAVAMRKGGEAYLPKFPEESQSDYKHRRDAAPFTNLYSDVSRSLAAKPFAREMKLKDGADQRLVDLCEDIDGQGNNLHVFAANSFQYSLDNGVDWILVDYTKAPPPESGKVRSIAEEKNAGIRPYWVHVSAERLLAVYTDLIDGKEKVVHARIREDVSERNGWEEITKCRVRVLDRIKLDGGGYAPATYQIWEKQTLTTGGAVWVSIEGPAPITIGEIALVKFMSGKRIGSTMRVRPPLRDVAYLQIEEFQQEANLKGIMEQCCFPMLAGNGIDGSDKEGGGTIRVPVGPRSVLFAPMAGDGRHGEWTYIEPSAQSIDKLMAHLDATQKNIRDLGLQPLTQANLTVITTANVALKANSQLQAWALALKDSLEHAFTFTAKWMGIDAANEPEVDIHTDFGVEIGDGTDVANLLKAEAQAILSKQTTLEEFKRRSFVSENVDIDDEQERLASEQQGLQPEMAMDPVTGEIVQPSTQPKVISEPPPLPAGANTTTAAQKLDEAIALHVKHMNGTAPTTGAAGEKSQMALMTQMKAARAALGGTSIATM